MASDILRPTAFSSYAACRKIRGMAGPYLKEWRKHLGLSQKQVVDRLSGLDDELLPTTEASLSRIETGKQPWGQRIVEALAHVYGISSEDLTSRNPIYEKERREALAKGDKVVDIRDFQCLDAADQERIVRLWNAVNEGGAA